VHERSAGHHRRVVAQVFCREVVAAVHDGVVFPEEFGGIRRGERLGVRVDRQVRPERPQRRGRGVGLPFPKASDRWITWRLKLWCPPGRRRSPRSARFQPPRDREGRGTPAPGAHDEHGRREEPLLPGLPQFLHEDVPAVTQCVFA